MKTSFLPWILAAALVACDPLGDRLPGFRSRSECGPHGPGRRAEPEPEATDTLAFRPLHPADTAVYFSAVRFPDGYDWQRDTAYGSVAFELLLYKDFEQVLALPSGADACFVPDPDRHHLLSGHLYTERMADGQTRIGRDGVELFRFPGREYLVGLLEDGEDLYTLSRPAKGPGFSFRKNGTPLLVRTDGAPFGDLSDPSYGATGALYRDQSQVCFCFAAGSAAERDIYAVRDGQEERQTGADGTVLDAKRHQGAVLLLGTDYRDASLREGRIWPEGASFAVTGRFAEGIGAYSGYLDAGVWDGPTRLCREEATLYRAQRETCAVSVDGSGTVRWYGPDGEGQEPLPCHFLTPACAAFIGGRPWLALTPRDTRYRPYVQTGTQVREVDVNGYVSSLSVTVSLPATKPPWTRPELP